MFHEAFHAERWAGAFFAVSGENADAVFLCLKALTPQVKSVRGVFFGHGAAAKLEKVLRDSAGDVGITDQSAEYAIRFLCLMVEKKCIRHIDSLLARIDQMLDERKGILDVSVESAVALNSEIENELTKAIKERTGAADIKMKTSVRPELLAGYLLRIGRYYVDASLKGQVESMTRDLGGR